MFKTGDLPANFFSESNTVPTPATTTNTTRKRNGKDGKNKDGRGRKSSDEEKQMQRSFKSKNEALEFSIYCETSANLSSRLRELKSIKRKLVREFADDHCSGDKKKVKTRFRLFWHFKERKEKEDGSDSNDLDDGSYIESQETLMEELYDLDRDIKSATVDYQTSETNKKNATSVLNDITNV